MRFAVSSLNDCNIRRSEPITAFILDVIGDPSVANVEVWFSDSFKVSKL